MTVSKWKQKVTIIYILVWIKSRNSKLLLKMENYLNNSCYDLLDFFLVKKNNN